MRGCGILMVGELLLLMSGPSSGVSVPPFGIYDELPWLRTQELRPPAHDYHRPVDPRDLSYLPEEAMYEEVEQDAADEPDETRLNRNDRSLLPEYRNLCETVTRKVELKNDPNYEYQPPHYHEIFCKSYSLMDDEPQKAVVPSKQKCAHPSFHCVQRSRTLFLVRRRWDGECWEPMTKVVASGCDCMWPVSTLGDVSIHY